MIVQARLLAGGRDLQKLLAASEAARQMSGDGEQDDTVATITIEKG
mgnify:CR=1 FL=1